MDIIDLTDGWLTDWREEGGAFKEWVREVQIEATGNGWVRALARWPGRWCRAAYNAASWLPFLWSDRDWDHAFLWRMMREKIRRMRLHHERDRVIADWEEVAGQMRRAEEILTRLIEDDYVREEWEAHREKYGSSLEKYWSSLGSGEEQPDGTRTYRLISGTERGDDVQRIGKLEWELKRADAELLGHHLAEHWWGWWS